MASQLFKRLIASLFFTGIAYASPLITLSRTPQGLQALRMITGMHGKVVVQNPHNVQRRHIAQIAVLSTTAYSAGQAVATGLCLGAACFGIESFYENFTLGPLSKATRKAIEQALARDEANALKALELVKGTKISFEKAYSKVYELNQQAYNISKQTGESFERVYKRLVYEWAPSEYKLQLEQDFAREQELARAIKNNFSNFSLPESQRNIDYAEAIRIVEEAQKAAKNPIEQPRGCGSTTPVVPDTSTRFPAKGPEPLTQTEIPVIKPDASALTDGGFQIHRPEINTGCQIPAEPIKEPMVLQREVQKKDGDKSMPPRIENTPQELAEAMKEIKKNYEWDNQKQAWRLKDRGSPICSGAIYVKEDKLHNEIELYDKRGRHMGALDPLMRVIIPNSHDKIRVM